MKYNFKLIASLLFFLPLSMSSMAQEGDNMVENGSFEATDGKVRKLGSIESALGWLSPTGSRADLFTSSKEPTIDVPLNLYGSEDAKDGGNYAGIVAYSYGNKVPRSYLMTKLKTPMKKGFKYCVSFNVSLAEASKYASNQLAANFSSKAYGTDSKTPIIEKSHVVDQNNKIFNGFYNWEQVCGVYVAEGGEKYITIGNFTSDEDTKNERNKKQTDVKVAQIIAAYYYIDNITVTLVEDMNDCACAPEEDINTYSKVIYQNTTRLIEDASPEAKLENERLYFAFGSDNFTVEGQKALDNLVEALKANPTWKVQILGHSDKTEDEVGKEKDRYSSMDSKRVNAVMKYLMDKGIAESRMLPSPQGSTLPSEVVSANDDEELTMAKNRRVGFKIRK